MKKRSVIALLLMCSLMTGLTGCGGSSSGSQYGGTATATTTIRRDVEASSDATSSAESESEEPDVPEEVTPTPTPEETSKESDVSDEEGSSEEETEAVAESEDYRFKNFVLNTASGYNAVFSGESYLSALSWYDQLIKDPAKTELADYIGKDMTKYKGTSAMKLVNRIWLDSDVSYNADGQLGSIIYPIDMADPSATETKNRYVSEQTSGFITSTPTSFSSDTVMDIMNVIYFKDEWVGGDKQMTTDTFTFHSLDGTNADIHMMIDTGTGYYQLDNAVAYQMEYDHGFYLTVIVPEEGVDLEDVDLTSLMDESAEFVYKDVTFYMPEFETSSTYLMKMRDLGIEGLGDFDTNVVDVAEDAMPSVISKRK